MPSYIEQNSGLKDLTIYPDTTPAKNAKPLDPNILRVNAIMNIRNAVTTEMLTDKTYKASAEFTRLDEQFEYNATQEFLKGDFDSAESFTLGRLELSFHTSAKIYREIKEKELRSYCKNEKMIDFVRQFANEPSGIAMAFLNSSEQGKAKILKTYFNAATQDDVSQLSKLLQEFGEFSIANKAFNFTGETVHPDTAKELSLDALVFLASSAFAAWMARGGQGGPAVKEAWYAINAPKIIRLAKFASALFVGVNTTNLTLGRFSKVDLSPKAYLENLLVCAILGATSTMSKAAIETFLEKYFVGNKTLVASASKEQIAKIAERIAGFQKYGIVAQELTSMLTLSAYGVARDGGEMTDHFLHNLIFVGMLKLGGKAVTLLGKNIKFDIKQTDSKETIEKEINPLIDELNQKALITTDAQLREQYRMTASGLQELVKTQNYNALNTAQKDLPRPQDLVLAASIKTELETHKARTWESTSLQASLNKNTDFINTKLKVIFDQVLGKHDPDGLLGLKNKIALYVYGSASRGEMPRASDIDALLVSTADLDTTKAFQSDLITLAYKAGISEAHIPLYYTKKESVPIVEIEWQEKVKFGNSFSHNAFNESQTDLSLESHSGISHFVDRKVLSGPDLLKDKLSIDKNKAEYRLLNSLKNLPDYSDFSFKKPRFKDTHQRPINIIAWANKLGISNIDTQPELRQVLFIREFLSVDLNNFTDTLTNDSFNEFFKKTENNLALRQEFIELFGNIKTFQEMQKKQNELHDRIKSKADKLIEIITQKEYIKNQILAYSTFQIISQNNSYLGTVPKSTILKKIQIDPQTLAAFFTNPGEEDLVRKADFEILVQKSSLDKAQQTQLINISKQCLKNPNIELFMYEAIKKHYVALIQRKIPHTGPFHLKTFNDAIEKAQYLISVFYEQTDKKLVRKGFDQLIKELKK